MSRILKLGLIGFGNIAKQHCRAFLHQGWQVPIALVRNKASSARHNPFDLILTESSKEFYSSSLDAVLISTPNNLHIPQGLEALKNGCKVLCEKPASSDMNGLDELVAQHSCDFMLALNYLQREEIKLAYEIINSGKLGDVVSVEATWMRHRGIPNLGGWFTQKQQSGGGVLIDLGVHMISLAWHLLNYPKWQVKNGEAIYQFRGREAHYNNDSEWPAPMPGATTDVEDRFRGELLFADAIAFKFDFAWAYDGPDKESQLVVKASKGELRWHKKEGLFLNGDLIAKTQLPSNPLVDARVDFCRQADAFESVVFGSKTHFNALKSNELQCILQSLYAAC